MIYFDNSATTLAAPQVLQTYQQVSQDFFGNPSSLHNLGDRAAGLLRQSRQQIAELIHAKPDEIYFTSGGTEGDNWVIKGTALAKRQFGKHLITTAVEHPAVKNSMAQLEQLGYQVTYLPVDEKGQIDPADLQAAIRPDTILVSIMAVNNEIGSIQPLAAAAKILRQYPKIHFHVDAVQSIGKGLLSLLRLPRIDFLTFSAHKFHGPRGTGFIYAKRGRQLAPLLTGGGQERNWRSGTENLPAIAGMAKALRLLLTDEQTKVKQQQAVKDKVYHHVAQAPKVTLFSQDNSDFAPHILCFGIAGVRGETIVHAFENHGIYISTTSACSSRSGDISGTLAAMKIADDVATSAIRISLDENNTLAEAQAFNAAFDKIYARFQLINS
ncbi:cysteine desulfurase family protein [Loigolactobacillus rennini]|uniref:Cysteine desulfurase n=1 Tax=Loigolactobacillus rennini DSM 20253 TaxID=1423796 RepID=A0A0R2D5A1_9LACO|nr:cysteine desulfurase family protein [Loigolactobacillus rennini]KRM99247.1 cysteine desulfurase [Loigolactobacillus rennini DSM 20253]